MHFSVRIFEDMNLCNKFSFRLCTHVEVLHRREDKNIRKLIRPFIKSIWQNSNKNLCHKLNIPENFSVRSNKPKIVIWFYYLYLMISLHWHIFHWIYVCKIKAIFSQFYILLELSIELDIFNKYIDDFILKMH